MLNLFILFTIGGIIGWIASVIMQAEQGQNVLLNILTGISGAYLAGLATNDGAINRGLGPLSLFGALCGSVLLLGIVTLIRRGRAR